MERGLHDLFPRPEGEEANLPALGGCGGALRNGGMRADAVRTWGLESMGPDPRPRSSSAVPDGTLTNSRFRNMI